MFKTLSQALRKKTHWLAARAGLTDKHAPSKDAVQLWDALRELNSRFLASPDSLLEQVKATHDHLRLRGKISRRYLSSVSPFLCSHDEFTALREWRDLSFLYKFRTNRNAGRLSLALPPLLADGKAELAAELLAEIAANPVGGWLSTSSIRYAVEQVQQLERAARIDAKISVQFREAFLNLLDATGGDWFSRLHDLDLIKAAVAVLTDLERYAAPHRSAVIAAVIRHYGLCPAFWRHCATKLSNATEPELIQASENWQAIQRALKAANPPSTECLQELATCLAWFHERRNADALLFMRDIVANHVKDHRQELGLTGREMLAWLCQAEPSDARRLEAHAIWPTYQPPAPGPNSNRLELLSSVEQTARLLQQNLLVVSVVRNEMTILPHFLDHYRKLGIASFVFVDNGSTDGTPEYLGAQPDVVLYSADTEYKNSSYGVAWQQAVLGNHCLGKWVVLADADEFLVYADCESRPLAQFLAEAEYQGADAVLTLMIDMYPFGSLDEADFTKSSPFQAAPWHDAKPLIEWRLGSGQYSNATNYLSALRHRLTKTPPPNAFMSQKMALVRYQPWLRYSAGLHNAANVIEAKTPAAFAHFKYHAGFQQKVREEIRREQHYNNAEEYKRYVALLNEASDGFRGRDAVKFTNSVEFMAAATGTKRGL